MNRFGSIAGVLAVFVVIAAALFFFLSQDGQEQARDTGTEEQGTASAPSSETAAATSTSTQPESRDEAGPATPAQVESESVAAGSDTSGQAEDEAATESVAAVTEVEEPAAGEATPRPATEVQTGIAPPAFDVVRVEPSGDAVMAGTAPPGSRVRITDNGRDLGTVETNQSGTWVMVLEEPLAPGTHELSLVVETESGTQIVSDNVVVIAVPERETQMAAANDSTDAEASGEAAGGSASATEGGQGEPGEGNPLVVLMSREGNEASRVMQQALADVSKGVGEGQLILESIDYDETGQAVIAGRAPANARLIVYLDNYPLGTAKADPLGRWELVPTRVIPAGLHKLRIDQVSEDGTVLARVESPFSRADPLEELPDRTFVIVQPGNSLWRIARATYGAGVRYSVIYEANKNQISDPDLIYPGQVFRVPQEN